MLSIRATLTDADVPEDPDQLPQLRRNIRRLDEMLSSLAAEIVWAGREMRQQQLSAGAAPGSVH